MGNPSAIALYECAGDNGAGVLPQKTELVKKKEFAHLKELSNLALFGDMRVMIVLVAVTTVNAGKGASASELQIELKQQLDVTIHLPNLYVILDQLLLQDFLTFATSSTKGRPKALYKLSGKGSNLVRAIFGAAELLISASRSGAKSSKGARTM